MWYEDIRLKVAENGFILSYTEISKKNVKKGDAWENMSRNYKEKVFEFSNNGEAIKEMIRMGSIKNKNMANYAKEIAKESTS